MNQTSGVVSRKTKNNELKNAETREIKTAEYDDDDDDESLLVCHCDTSDGLIL